MPTRRRLATGIYEDRYGRAVVYSIHGHPKETRFPKDAPLERLIRWRKTQLGQAAERTPRDPRGSLARDVVLYLKRLKGTAGYKSEKSHLRAWLKHLRPGIRRWQITRELVELAIAEWRTSGYAPRTIRHRCRALQGLFRRLDGAHTVTPIDDAVMPKKPRGRAVSVADAVITDVALNLFKQEHDGVGRLRDSKTRARFLVLATTGRRPAEVKRAQREDVDLHRRLWLTRTAKGGINSALILNDEMVSAWQLFISARAWGAYDDRSFAKTLRRNGWPAGIRPYNMRHSTAIAIRARGGDLEDVQDQLGHASIATAREFYLQALPARQAAISQKLAGRFQAAAFRALPRRTPTIRPRTDAKGCNITPQIAGSVQQSGRSRGHAKSTKTAQIA